MVGAIHTAITSRPVSFDERTILDEIKDLDEDCILVGLFDRMGIPHDQIESILTTYKSALSGKVHSQETTGITFFKFGNFESARIWLTRAAKGGSKMARFQLGVMYISGRGCPVDPERAEAIFRSFTNDPDEILKSKAYHNLGLIYSVKENLNEMEYCFSEAAKMDNLNSIRNLGDFYYRRKEMDKSQKMYQRSHDLGDPCGTFRLARFAKSEEEAGDLIAQASKNGSWRATVYMSFRFFLGQTAVKDFRYVRKLLQKVYPTIPLEHKVKASVLNLIWYMKVFGDGTPPDDFVLPRQLDSVTERELPSVPKPRSLEEDACWARDNLDFKKAIKLFAKSAETDGIDSPRVHFNLGMIYFHGLGLDTKEADHVKSLYHFNRYINLTEPNCLHNQVLAMMDELVKIMINFPEVVPMLREMGFVE